MIKGRNASILVLGSEVVSGATLDTNSSFLAKELTALSFQMREHVAVKDDLSQIRFYLEKLLSENQIVIMTGGLGPTFDDITKKALSNFFGAPLVYSSRQYERVRKYFKRRKRKPHSFSKWQASFPEGAVLFDNDFGVAAGLAMQKNGNWVIALPGVPGEARGMFCEQVVPFLKSRFPVAGKDIHLSAKILRFTEVEILKKLGSGFPPLDRETECGIYPSPGEVVLRMRFEGPSADANYRKWKRIISRTFKEQLIGFTEENLETVLLDLLVKKKQTLSVAESLTGGLIAKRLTDVPGASRVFRGGLIAYHNSIKERELDVSPSLIKKCDVVSAEVACRMAESIRKKFQTHWGVAVTGNAGPGHSGSRKPEGELYIAISSSRGVYSERFRLYGGREKVRWHVSQNALAMLREALSRG